MGSHLMVAGCCGYLGLWLEVWDQKVEPKKVRADLTAAGLSLDPEGRSLSLFDILLFFYIFCTFVLKWERARKGVNLSWWKMRRIWEKFGRGINENQNMLYEKKSVLKSPYHILS